MNSIEEYNAKFNANLKYSGKGLDASVSYPCPACAEPDFLKASIFNMEEALAKESVCKHCKRGFKTLFHMKNEYCTQAEVVQTKGKDLPKWYSPILRRVSS